MERATFDDYKARLNGGSPDLWVEHTIYPEPPRSEPLPLWEVAPRVRAESLDLAGGSCLVDTSW